MATMEGMDDILWNHEHMTAALTLPTIGHAGLGGFALIFKWLQPSADASATILLLREALHHAKKTVEWEVLELGRPLAAPSPSGNCSNLLQSLCVLIQTAEALIPIRTHALRHQWGQLRECIEECRNDRIFLSTIVLPEMKEWEAFAKLTNIQINEVSYYFDSHCWN